MSSLNPPIRSWQGQRVWLIGASSGIGAALAQALLAAGAKVVVSARRADQLVNLVGDHNNALVLPFDAAAPDIWPSHCHTACDWLGGLDLVLFIAARYEPQRSWAIDPASAEASFQLNVLSIYRALPHLIPTLQQQGHGGIGLVASVAGYTGLPEATVYGASKAALINLAETLYFDLAPQGLGVYLINPGFVETPMTSRNAFAMPELITPSQAAQAIMAGLQKGDFEIRFPRRFTLALRIISRLPYRWRFALLHKMTGL